MNYNNKFFKAIDNTPNGETSEETIFHYQQEGNILTANYSGGDITKGHLIGTVDDAGVIEMRYHQVNTQGQIRTGQCTSTPEILEDGHLILHESWQWTSGDFSSGTSIVSECTVNDKSILEVAILEVIQEAVDEFEMDFAKAQEYIASIDGYISHTLHKCIEQNNKYILLVNWRTLADHTVGFRQSAAYKKWKKLLHHYYDPFPTVEHYTQFTP